MKNITPLDLSDSVVQRLCSLYDSYGYTKYKMSKFEEYDLYSKNKDFLIADEVITFNDGGRLLALKPDVTLSIIKNCETFSSFCQKLYYNEKVYRPSGETHSFREITQTGLECIGEIDLYTLCEVLSLAAKSLSSVSDDYVIDVGHVGILDRAFVACGIEGGLREKLTALIGEKNLHELRGICVSSGVSEADIERVSLFITEHGRADDVLPVFERAFPGDSDAFDELRYALTFANSESGKERLSVDFSVIASAGYYNGAVFKGYVRGCADAALSGGQYGNLVKRMGKDADALGFAVYVDEIVKSSSKPKEYDADAVILYDGGTDIEKLKKETEKYRQKYGRVLVERSIPEAFRAKETVDLRTNGGAK